MAKHEIPFKPRSLAQHFAAPDGFIGSFGWVCGYSADASFLDIATEYFTGQTRLQRAHGGRIALALILDPSNPQISMVDVPGVAHLPILRMSRKPFQLMHAKVALLAFCSAPDEVNDEVHWQLRLIVSTGNWTRATLENNLDLVWWIDVKSAAALDFDSQACADIKAAWGLFKWLRGYFDSGLLDAAPAGDNHLGSTQTSVSFESWIKQVSAKAADARPRFFDNRGSSLLSQLPRLIESTGRTVKRNYLAIGSGFYEAPKQQDESPDAKGSVPSVIGKLMESLKQQKLLTEAPDTDVFVNPKACQAVVTWRGSLPKKLSIREPGRPAFFGENADLFLHAKFVFSANWRENSNLCNSAWIYLGSGNITIAGFSSKANAVGGNLESGVVFAPENLYWYRQKENKNDDQIVTELLPIQWGKTTKVEELQGGADMHVGDELFVAPPISWLRWCEAGASNWLETNSTPDDACDVLDQAGAVCELRAPGQYSWSGSRPLEVTVRWQFDGKNATATVPVMDKFGRFSATMEAKIELDEAGWLLDSFPMSPDNYPTGGDPRGEGASSTNNALTPPTVVATYPIREMMQFIEKIAAKQTALCERDWPAWCVRLEQCLEQAAASKVVKAFLPLMLNPLSPLFGAPFRPDFAESADTEPGRRYEALLVRTAATWGVTSFKDIGSVNETQI